MFNCVFIRRKLYDLLDDSLPKNDKIKIRKHLEVCNSCSKRLQQIRSILDLATQKKMITPTDEFWHDFKIDLDRRLNQKLVGPLVAGRPLSYRLRPAIAFACILLFILTIGIRFYLKPGRLHIAKDDSQVLAQEIILLEEVSGSSFLNHNEDAYIQEINLFYQLDQDVM